MATEIMETLCSAKKIDRDRGIAALQSTLSNNPDTRFDLETLITQMLTSSENTEWEKKHGCLLAAKEIIPSVNLTCEEEALFINIIRNAARKLLTDDEVRVRLESGEALGALCRKIGPIVYEEEKDFVLNLVRVNLERQSGEDATLTERMESEKLVEKLVRSQRRNSADAAQIFHDTAGWRNLETGLKCVQSMVAGCRDRFLPMVDRELLDLLFRTLSHTNRFVRETGFYVCSALVECGKSAEGAPSESNPVLLHGNEFSLRLAAGLADNWSQVRLAASDATRNFLLALPEPARDRFFPQLLPRMCLNRYYVAEGVRIFSQDTWVKILGNEGRETVRSHIGPTVDYYYEATSADNHAVREAACACIAELATKIDPTAVKPYVPRLLDTLLTCFKDDSWPVRDAACLACGQFVHSFPADSAPSLDSLYPLFLMNLGDPIASVRQGAAVALANVVRAYGSQALKTVVVTAEKYLAGVKDQKPERAEIQEGGCDSQATYGVIKRRRDNDPELHTDRQMYSCGSLAPKMGRGGGCSDHKFNRPSELWEKADGSVCLLSELSSVAEAREEVLRLLPLAAEACSHQHYPQHVVLLETLCYRLPLLAKNLGKPFKRYLDFFLDPVFRAVESENALTSTAASQCLNQLSNQLGPSIFRARVASADPRFLELLERQGIVHG